MKNSVTTRKVSCYHCGLECPDDAITLDDKPFCCTGCRTVYRFIAENRLQSYYSLDQAPGTRPSEDAASSRFAYLDDPVIRDLLVDHIGEAVDQVVLSVPQIHCASCVWLLEKLYRLHPGIEQSQVDFLRRELTVTFAPRRINIRQLVELLTSIGYEPRIQLDALDKETPDRRRPPLYYKIGIAGFALANIMLLSFPEYLSLGGLVGTKYARFFGWVNMFLALPVLAYSASDYYRSAWTGLRCRTLSIDVPISLGIAVLFSRSVYEVVTASGAGYFDSLAGLVFLLLLGKLYQQKTYASLSFDRDFKAYFPISVMCRTNRGEVAVPVMNLTAGDRIVIRNRELVPADSILVDGAARIDYSFITGEAEPQAKAVGDRVEAGGRQVGGAIELEVVRAVSRSRLMQLWNNEAFVKTREPRLVSLANHVGKYFTAAVLAIAAGAAVYWLPRDTTTAVNAVTSVLIIACPCALALSSPFTLGTGLRILGRHRLFLRNSAVIEQLAHTDTVVFDKTGTLTRPEHASVTFHGSPLSESEQQMIAQVAHQSMHPLSRCLSTHLSVSEEWTVHDFQERAGGGISAVVDGHTVRLGKAAWVGSETEDAGDGGDDRATGLVYVSIDGAVRGCFQVTGRYRPELSGMVAALKNRVRLAVLSGDNDRDRGMLTTIFGSETTLRFRQAPLDKLAYVKGRQSDGRTVLMVGDGLNDAGALRQADVGIAVSEDAATFSPACDGILDAGVLPMLPNIIRLAGLSLTIIKVAFGISFLYNVVGLSVAVTGQLKPVVSAILMPLSSVSVVAFATLATLFASRWVRLR